MNKQSHISQHVLSKLLSKLGKRIFFPLGIIAQTEESAHAKIKATAGMAFEDHTLAVLPETKEIIDLHGLQSSELFAYAPTKGLPALRTKWKEYIAKKNPSMNQDYISTPIVSSGITHGVSSILHLILDPDDVLVSPDCFWENYQHISEVVIGASVKTFPLFDNSNAFNIVGLEAILKEHLITKKKTVLLFNFPNNPTGFSIRTQEVDQVTSLLLHYAEQGLPIMTISDDAYFGLFYEEDIYKESLFAVLSQLHENIFAVKLDGSTKELLSWGLRVGFITFGGKNISKEVISEFESKITAFIRATVTSSSRVSQQIVLQLLNKDTLDQSIQHHKSQLQERFGAVKKAILQASQKYPNAPISPIPANSGYFISFNLSSPEYALKIRNAILEKENIALIAISNKIRFAFSCVEPEEVPLIIDTIYRYA